MADSISPHREQLEQRGADPSNPYPWLKKTIRPKWADTDKPSPQISKTRRVRSRLFHSFPILSYLKVLILCIPPCYWPCGWPRHRNRKRRLRGGVDYLDYEESTHEKKGNKTAAKRFIIDNDRRGFAEMQYMPEARNGVIRLIYLTTINALDCGKLPYTRSQQDVFEISSKADWWTMLCLNLAMVLVPLLGLCSMFSALVFIQSLNSDSVVLLPAGLSALCAFMSGILGVVSTGTNPHFASVAANEKQNVLAELETDFATLAIDLLEMYDSQDRATRDFARRIARGLKIGVVQGLLAKQTEWSITEPLREAKRFILHKNVCFHSTIIRTYLTKDHRHEMKRRKALSKAENYFKKLNIPIPDDDCMSSEYGTLDMPTDTDTATELDDIDDQSVETGAGSNLSSMEQSNPSTQLGQRSLGARSFVGSTTGLDLV
jgi:hypothetical protein